MPNETQEKLDVVNVKSVLIGIPPEEVKKACSEEDKYNRFVCTILNILTKEPAFFLMMPGLIDKTREILEYKRFDFVTEENCEKINDVISKLNQLSGLPIEEKKMQRSIYFSEQSKLRERTFLNEKELVISIAQDFRILSSMVELRNDGWQLVDLLSTLNYTAKTMPGFFEEYPHTKDVAMDILEPIANQKGIRWFLPRRNCKKTIANIQKVKTIKSKEE